MSLIVDADVDKKERKLLLLLKSFHLFTTLRVEEEMYREQIHTTLAIASSWNRLTRRRQQPQEEENDGKTICYFRLAKTTLNEIDGSKKEETIINSRCCGFRYFAKKNSIQDAWRNVGLIFRWNFSHFYHFFVHFQRYTIFHYWRFCCHKNEQEMKKFEALQTHI